MIFQNGSSIFPSFKVYSVKLNAPAVNKIIELNEWFIRKKFPQVEMLSVDAGDQKMAEVTFLVKTDFQDFLSKMHLVRNRSKSEDISAKAARRGSFCKVRAVSHYWSSLTLIYS